MKRNFRNFGMLFTAFLFISICGCVEEETVGNNAEIVKMNELNATALNNMKQRFTISVNPNSPLQTWVSESGVRLTINTSTLTKNGVAVSGNINMEFVEIFDKGRMVAANIPTMGLKSDGTLAPLISAGEFYVQAIQDGVKLAGNNPVKMEVPTNSYTDEMKLWKGIEDTSGSLVWTPLDMSFENSKDSSDFISKYYVFPANFGWINCDYFFNDPRPQMTLKVKAPDGFNGANCRMNFSVDGKVVLGTFSDTNKDGLFESANLPIGLRCHVVVVAVNDAGIWKWAIKGVTTAENEVVVLSTSDLTTGTEAQLIAAMNLLP